ncbi:MAG: hypothetical protein AAFZ63_06665 [Bacteroidota bacterium]
MYQRKKLLRHSIRLWILTLLLQTFTLPVAQALTSGPSQPEMTSLAAVGTTDMVDLFTGDFNYQIPLMDVEGYPITLNYSSDVTAEEEASWVGLGWSLNPGSINREVRGLPDDFKGDLVDRTLNIKPDRTVGVGVSPGLEVIGFEPGGLYGSIYYNNYRGFGTSFSLSPSLQLGRLFSLGFTLSGDSQQGAGVGIGIGARLNKRGYSLNTAANVSSRQGLSRLTLNGKSGLKNKGARPMFGIGIGVLSNGFAYTPIGEIPMQNTSFRFRGTFGAEIFAAHPNLSIDGYYSSQALSTDQVSSPAFGTLYAEDGQNVETALTDYNRENYGTYEQSLPNLPPVVGTYDYFSASAAGLSTSFHVNRSQVGLFAPTRRVNNDIGATLGGEFGLGALARFGLDVDLSANFYERKKWTNANAVANTLQFHETNQDGEAAYLATTGDMGLSDNNFYQQLQANRPIHTEIKSNIVATAAVNKWEINNISQASIGNNVGRQQRHKRTVSVSYLTAREAAEGGLDKQLRNYPENALVCPTCSTTQASALPRFDDANMAEYRQGHHISEITVTQADGTRYVYGLPTYNVSQEDVTISVTSGAPALLDPTDPNFGLIEYSGTEASTDNTSGRDNYYEKQETPAYAHGYLLTAVLSADYQDVTGDGVTDDDLGTATKFNYTRVSESYQWRTAVSNSDQLATGSAGVARYVEGNRADDLDDKASYSYGAKELWYLHSIESRSMLAHFLTVIPDDPATSDNEAQAARLDAVGINSNGLIADAPADTISQRTRRLQEIRLYTKSEIARANAASPVEQPEPLKTAHLSYEYTLCTNTPNSVATNGAKLTLKTVGFTFGNSKAGLLHPYRFNYRAEDVSGDTTVDYQQAWVNRWGYYQDNPTAFPNQMDFPYALQDTSSAQAQTALWNLDEVILPSGGKIEVTYESDDYAYVQNKRAGRMFFVEGFQSGTTSLDEPISRDLYGDDGEDDLNLVAVVDIEEARGDLERIARGVPLTNLSAAQIRQFFFADMEQLYFKCLLRLIQDTTKNNYVAGYADIEFASLNIVEDTQNPAKLKLLVELKPVQRKASVHPITQAGLQKLRLEIPELIYPRLSLEGSTAESVVDAIGALLSSIGTLGELFRNFERHAMRKNWSRTLASGTNAMVRLADPSFQKFGGGSRVARLEISDAWQESTGIAGTGATYGQTYEYQIEDEINGVKRMISSGIAAWEPLLGGEENLGRKPDVYEDRNHLAPSNYFYIEAPYVESLFPAPVIGYRQVKVESINNAEDARTATGWTIHDFYTAKEFPTFVQVTRKDEIPITSIPLTAPFTNFEMEKMAATQGYVVETNDMHGKPRSMRTYNAQGALLESTDYQYLVEDPQAEELRLKNTVQFVNKQRNISTGSIGLEVNLWQEMSQEDTYVNAGGVESQVDVVSLPLPFPLSAIAFPIVTVYPSLNSSIRQLRTSVTTKHIRRYGIVEKVIVTKHGSSLESENLLYDEETGKVLLSSTENEFREKVYTWNFPAYWAYDGMRPAYENIRAELPTITVDNSGLSNLPTGNEYWAHGDEVLLYDPTQDPIQFESGPFFLYQADTLGQLYWLIIEESGVAADYSNPMSALIIRSGQRNQSMAQMQSVMLLEDPRVIPMGESLPTSIRNPDSLDVIQASAVEMNDRWSFNCDQDPRTGNPPTDEVTFGNVFLRGIDGNWRLSNEWTMYNAEARTKVDFTTSHPIEKSVAQKVSGISVDSMFWREQNGVWEPNPNPDWLKTTEVSYYNRLGQPLQTKDALDIASTVQFGYNNVAAVATVANAELREIGFESFEDYYFDNAGEQFNTPRHFYLLSPLYDTTDQQMLTEEFAHTGRYSLRLNADRSIRFPLANADCSDKDYKGSYGLELDCDDCLPRFSPYIGREYHFSGWIADNGTLDCALDLAGASLEFRFFNSTQQQVGTTQTPATLRNPVDGWVRVQGAFLIPSGAATLEVTLKASSGGNTFFDDLRIMPEDAVAKGFVYDPASMRLLAELDDNNYAVIYEYDDAGLLSRIKRETERGVVTIQEGRTVMRLNP